MVDRLQAGLASVLSVTVSPGPNSKPPVADDKENKKMAYVRRESREELAALLVQLFNSCSVADGALGLGIGGRKHTPGERDAMLAWAKSNLRSAFDRYLETISGKAEEEPKHDQ